MKQPRNVTVSIVILTKNSEQTLESCLQKLRTAIRNIECEIVIVDGCSEDQTLCIVSKYFPKAHIYSSNGNLAQCRKLAIQASKGEYICMIDSDIEIPSQFFELLQLFKNPQIGCVSGRFELVKDGIIKRYYNSRKDYAQIRNTGIIERDNVGSACTIYRATILKHCLPDERLFVGEDKDMALSIKDLNYKVLLDTSIFCPHTRKSNLLDEMKRMFKFGQVVPIIYERHPKYKQATFKRKIASLFVSFFFPPYYATKVHKLLHYGIIAWLLALSYNLGFMFPNIGARQYQ